MGTILKDPISKVDVYNWRLLSEWESGVSICIGPDLFIIQDLTPDQVHEINYNDTEIVRDFKFERVCLTCHVCAGKGYIDWISKATQSTKRQQHEIDFIRDPKGPVHYFIPEDYYGPQKEFDWFITSTPPIREGDELCPHCHGCGLNLIKKVQPRTQYSLLRC